MIAHIANETGYPKSEIKEILDSYENQLMVIIATQDNYKIGNVMVLYGFTRPPMKLHGKYELVRCTANEEWDGWSAAKIGVPKAVFTKEAKEVVTASPDEYFSWPENRYTTNARNYRRDTGQDEIPEFEGLSEEKIEEINNEFDKKKFSQEFFARFVDQRVAHWYYPMFLEGYTKRKLRGKTTQQKKEMLAILGDKQAQLDAGVPEDQIVEHTYPEIMAARRKRCREDMAKDAAEYWKAVRERQRAACAANPEAAAKRKEERKKKKEANRERIKQIKREIPKQDR